MAKQNNGQNNGGDQNPVIKQGKETPVPTPPQDVKDK